jgi:hypothetical protein
VLDFDTQMATVVNVLEGNRRETVRLSELLERAASFGDDPSLGDGLTQLQRRPATYEVDARGETSRRRAQHERPDLPVIWGA